MNRKGLKVGLLSATVLVVSSMPVLSGGPGSGVRGVDAERLMNARSEPGNWMTHGGTYAEQRFADLSQINAANVK